MKRIFTAIDISEAAREQCSRYIRKLRAAFPNLRVGWERPEKLHLTMKFLGDIDASRLLDLTEAVEKTARRISDFSLRISGTGVFPSEKKARILWLGVTDEFGSLLKLNEMLEDECEKRGFAGDKRKFKPHLTIARLREPNESTELIAEHRRESFRSDEFTISEITIYESRLQKSGSIYQKVSSFKFQVQDSRINSALNLEPET